MAGWDVWMLSRVDYSLDKRSEEYQDMWRTQRCMVCGNPLDETVTAQGTMLTCVAQAVERGHEGDSVVYEGLPGCGKMWWVDED